jgi:hypothetical protein
LSRTPPRRCFQLLRLSKEEFQMREQLRHIASIIALPAIIVIGKYVIVI